ncbi:SDR family NAD(P)-dependent oxidoreductase [Sandaracinobacteroides hominis]|uniref:SDR family NAD(P)-dependent oxidoreductase n=1 Tax=Sandaracinobacteroides hominis TaxID=2780086 RepID=UPI0018F36CB9|nr:SDR family NAD(P)-dependent oxidoreductase [Sandaracinobacteroides hominis]
MPVPNEFQTADGNPPIALITGGAKRIGAAFCRALAEDGFRVAIHCNRSRAEADELAAELPGEPIVLQADLASPDIGALLVDALPAPPHLLLNNASLFEEDSLQTLDLELWQRHMAVNLLAPTLLVQAFQRRLPGDARGLIVNLSDAKLAAPNPDFFSYTVSKIGLAGLTELSARTLAPRIRVNAIAPAVTLVSGPQSRANFEKAHVLNPLGRGVHVDDLVRALRYLVATPTITGETLRLDSGQRFLALPRDVAYMVQP